MQVHVSAEMMTIIFFLFCSIVILASLRFFGLAGLYVYNILSIIVANIQVLRLTVFESFTEPVALGTVLFTSTFFVNDLISEHYGPKAAKKSLSLGFWAQIVMVIWMVLTVAHPMVPAIDAGQHNQMSQTLQEALNSHQAMMQLFVPSLRILIASLIAYWCSQFLDILLFAKIRQHTENRFLWLRQNSSMLIGGLLDTIIFSIFAWKIFGLSSISWYELFMTYILSAQIIRTLLSLASTPIMYLSYHCLPLHERYKHYDRNSNQISSQARNQYI